MSAPLPSLGSAAWLTAISTQRVLACLNRTSHVARVVGGAVRNTLLGLPVTDIDIATSAEPAQVIAAAGADGFKTFETGIEHGTVTIVVDGHSFEVTTLRHDVETDGRRAKVAFTDDWTADASRRDLTLNALYCDADGTIFDPLGGLADVLARRVRFIGDPHARIREDYLRILRFFRFTAQYAEGPIDAEGVAASIAERDGLRRLSAERVRAEFLRLLTARRACEVVKVMAEHGLLTAILPVAPRLGQLARVIEIETALGHRPDARLRLAALTVAVEEDAGRLARHLRLSADERDVLHAAATSARLSPAMPEHLQRVALYRQGAPQFLHRVLLDWAASGAATDDKTWRNLIDLPARWTPPPMPFSGRDLLARGLQPGPRVGEMLLAFEAWWIASDFPGDSRVLEARLTEIVAAG